MGAHVRVATPVGYEPAAEIVAEARRAAKETRGKIELFHSARGSGCGRAGAFTPMSGPAWDRKKKREARAKVFAPFQVNTPLMKQAAPDAVFLHCLPAHRGWEVTDEVMDSPRSLVFDQAENRLHVQKAILLVLLS